MGGSSSTDSGWVIRLGAEEAPTRRVGSKAARLHRLCRLGFAVPPVVVLSTAVLEAFVREAGLTGTLSDAAEAMAHGDGDRARATGRAAAESIRTAPLPVVVDEALVAGLCALEACTSADEEPLVLAVRSSAVGEDGESRSHAGQYESLLNVSGIDAVRGAVREVWASWFSDRAISYRLTSSKAVTGSEGGMAGASWSGSLVPPMAVVLQQMVVPRASGMLFTADPVTGDKGEMMIEAAPGLGEALAQALVHPDLFRVSRRGSQAHELRISERAIAPKERHLVPSPLGSGELVFQPLPEALQLSPSLDDDEVLKLAGLGLRAEEELGSPLDIEWVLDTDGELHVLQARPVTGQLRGSGLPRGGSLLRSRPILWTQRFSGERWTDLATPLGWSLVQPVLHHFTLWEAASKRWLSSSLPTRLYRGRPYFNLSIFRHLVFRLPGGSPPQFILEMFPPDEQEELRSDGPLLPNMALVGSIVTQLIRERRWERYHYNFVTNYREWEDFQPGFEARVQALSLAFTEPEEGLGTVEEARNLMVEYVGLHLLSLLFAHLSYEALGQMLRSWVGLSGEVLRSALVANCEDNQTLRCNRALWALAVVAASDDSVNVYLTSSPQPSLEGLEGLTGGAAFRQELDQFLADYGHRSSASWEIFAPRWADSPELVLRLVAGYLRNDLVDDPRQMEQRRRSDREQAERLVRSRMARTRWRRLFPWRQQAFNTLLGITRQYVLLRENQRFSFDRLLLRFKQVLERMGALLERDGLLDAGADIVFLEIDEVSALARGVLQLPEARARIALRRSEFEQNRRVDHPDFLEEGGEGDVESVALAGSSSSFRDLVTLSGLAISPGRVRGRVCVLRSLDDVHKLKPGDILVARAADSGWTPLFLTAGALVLELGSMLSHAAVVAREYGLPAIVNVEGATRMLHDGMEVTVDGHQGRLLVHRAQNDPERRYEM